MALQTETNPNRDVLMNDSQILTFLQNDDVYLLGEPIMVYPEEDGSPECTIVEMENLQSDNMNMRDIVLADHDYFRVDNINTSNFNTPYGSLDHEMSYGYVSEGEQVNEGLAVLEILYNNVQRDQPEFIDVNDLTETDNIEKTEYNDSYVVSDEGGDEDDVIFVAEYKQNGDSGSPNWSDGNAPRRNPVRKVRNSKASRDLELYEEDFAFLDHSEYIDDKPLARRANASTSECFKQWPVNVNERPEYNEVTKKIESFDYTIRQIKNAVVRKKPKLEPKRKGKKKKYFARRRRKVQTIEEKKVPFSDLCPVINSTFDLFKEYLGDSGVLQELVKDVKSKSILSDAIKEVSNDTPCDQNKEDVKVEESEEYQFVKNQILLYVLVNNIVESTDVEKVFNKMDSAQNLKV